MQMAYIKTMKWILSCGMVGMLALGNTYARQHQRYIHTYIYTPASKTHTHTHTLRVKGKKEGERRGGREEGRKRGREGADIPHVTIRRSGRNYIH